MPKWERFENAPIVEALLDIRVKLPPAVSLSNLAAFHEAIKDAYPEKRERYSWQAGVQIGPGADPKLIGQGGGPDGYLFLTADGRKVVQARLDGFTFSWLRPYDRWATLCAEAKSQWEHYRLMFTPESVSRVALRYINRIELPMPIKDLKEYLLTGPETAPGMPDKLQGFFLQLVVPHDDLSCTAVVTETIEPQRENILPLIFDIDVFQEQAFGPESGDLWDAFEHLRDFKNDIFFKSITDKTKELFG